MRLFTLALGWLFACSTPVVKEEVLAPELLTRQRLPASRLHHEPEIAEWRVTTDIAWMSDVDPLAHVTFAGLRAGDITIPCQVLECAPHEDRLVLRPLSDGGTAIEVLADPERLRAARERARAWAAGARDDAASEYSLRELVDQARLGSPLPPPGHVFAVAANFPSHLEHDLRISLPPERRAALSSARARVFLKYPSTAPPGYPAGHELGFSGLLGPFDAIEAPATMGLPMGEDTDETVDIPLRLDYEVEVGAVFGRELTPEYVAGASDAELLAAVAGYVLATDSKSRNPQVLDRAKRYDLEPTGRAEPYRPADPGLDGALGIWDDETCAWWSHAASFGNFTALGPFLVAAPLDGSFPPRILATARTYAEPGVRGAEIPGERRADTPYLRQLSEVTDRAGDRDELIWKIPDIVRSILAEDSVLPWPEGDERRIARGDVVCLGTPGGVVITAKAGIGFLRCLLFWWDARDWHDAFFDRDAELYLRNGDQVLYWSEGLGFQRQRVRVVGGDG